MVSITNIQQQTAPVTGSATESRPAKGPEGPASSPRNPETKAVDDKGRQDPVTSPEAPRVPDYLDPTRVEAYLSRVAEAIEKAADGPHVVGFRLDPESGVYIVEVKDRQGELVTTLSPQKILNRGADFDEPTGMLVDHLS